MSNLSKVFSFFRVVADQRVAADKDATDKVTDITESETSPETQGEGVVEVPASEESVTPDDKKENESNKLNEEILKTLGEDPNASNKSTHHFHPELKSRWEKCLKEGLSEKSKTNILEKYTRTGDIRLEAPKVNLGVPMTEAATKRDKHFIELQNTIGSAIAAQAAAISMMLESSPGEDIDQESFF
ncbi:hypothetical protein KQX54_017102 [Cotesia glomerata]|uniref:Uncharacterized protein n=1 Tax=Cotesia glomerata TaxID=32391 RepID=A0AAV7I044_COTGL|nr:hypothetical protein KQX54_017102 [Cotesia glomerata]